MGVTGIGGFFFRARDPEAMPAWYAEHLGIGSWPYGLWEMQAGPGVFAPFAADTDYFATLRAAGMTVTTKAGWNMPGVGRFARLHDPEGNPVELWQRDQSA
jgi:hypothetical protein